MTVHNLAEQRPVGRVRPEIQKTFVVEKGVPYKKPNAGRPRSFPFLTMDVGDSFGIETKQRYEQVRRAMNHVNKAEAVVNGKRFAVHVVQEDGFYARCWRLEDPELEDQN